MVSAFPIKSIQEVKAIITKYRALKKSMKDETKSKYERRIVRIEFFLSIWPIIFYVLNMLVVILGTAITGEGEVGADTPLRASKFMNSFYSIFTIKQFFTNCLEMSVIQAKIAIVEKEREEAKLERKENVLALLKEKKNGLKKEENKKANKIVFYFILMIIPPFIFIVYKLILKAIMNNSVLSEVPHKVLDVMLNIFVFLKLARAVLKFIYAIFNLIKTLAKLKMIQNQLNIEVNVRENYSKNLAIQNSYLFLRYHTSIFETLRFNFNYLEKEYQMLKFNKVIGDKGNKGYRQKESIQIHEELSINTLENDFEDIDDSDIPEEHQFGRNANVSLRTFGEPPVENVAAIQILDSIENPYEFNEDLADKPLLQSSDGYIYPFIGMKKENKLDREEFIFVDQTKFFFNFCSEAAEFCYRYWELVKLNLGNEILENDVWNTIFHDIALAPIVQPEISYYNAYFQKFRSNPDKSNTRYYNKFTYTNEYFITYKRNFFSKRFLKDIVIVDSNVGKLVTDPANLADKQNNVFEIADKLSENGNNQVHMYLDEDFVFFVYSDITTKRSLSNINMFNPLRAGDYKDISSTIPELLPVVRTIDLVAPTGNIEINAKLVLRPENKLNIDVLTMKWTDTDAQIFYVIENNFYHYSTTNTTRNNCLKIESYDIVCNEIRDNIQINPYTTSNYNQFAYPYTYIPYRFKTKNMKVEANTKAKTSFQVNLMACHSTEIQSQKEILKLKPQKYELRSNSHWKNCSQVVLSDTTSVLTKHTGDIEHLNDILFVPSDDLTVEVINEQILRVKELMTEYKQKSCDNLKKINEIKKKKGYSSCFPSPKSCNHFYLISFHNPITGKILLEDIIPTPYRVNEDVTLLRGINPLKNPSFTNAQNEESIRNKLLTIDDFSKHFRETMINYCNSKRINASVMGSPLIIDDLGFFYAHDAVPPSQKSISRTINDPKWENWTKSIKGKALFGYGSKNNCFSKAVLSPRYRFLVPLKKKSSNSSFYFQMIKALDIGKIKGYVFKLVEAVEVEDVFETNLKANANFDANNADDPSEENDDNDPSDNGSMSDGNQTGEESSIEFREEYSDLSNRFSGNRGKKNILAQSNKESNTKRSSIGKMHKFKDIRSSHKALRTKKRIHLAHRSQTKSLKNKFGTKSIGVDALSSLGYKIDYADSYEFFYVEFWFNKYYWQVNRVEYIMHLNNNAIKDLIEKCFVPYWPPTKRDYRNLSEEEEAYSAERGRLPDFAPSGDLFANFYYNRNKNVAFRLWVKFDYRTTYEEELFQKEAGCNLDRSGEKKKLFKKRIY